MTYYILKPYTYINIQLLKTIKNYSSELIIKPQSKNYCALSGIKEGNFNIKYIDDTFDTIKIGMLGDIDLTTSNNIYIDENQRTLTIISNQHIIPIQSDVTYNIFRNILTLNIPKLIEESKEYTVKLNNDTQIKIYQNKSDQNLILNCDDYIYVNSDVTLSSFQIYAKGFTGQVNFNLSEDYPDIQVTSTNNDVSGTQDWDITFDQINESDTDIQYSGTFNIQSGTQTKIKNINIIHKKPYIPPVSEVFNIYSKTSNTLDDIPTNIYEIESSPIVGNHTQTITKEINSAEGIKTFWFAVDNKCTLSSIKDSDGDDVDISSKTIGNYNVYYISKLLISNIFTYKFNKLS